MVAAGPEPPIGRSENGGVGALIGSAHPAGGDGREGNPDQRVNDAIRAGRTTPTQAISRESMLEGTSSGTRTPDYLPPPTYEGHAGGVSGSEGVGGRMVENGPADGLEQSGSDRVVAMPPVLRTEAPPGYA